MSAILRVRLEGDEGERHLRQFVGPGDLEILPATAGLKHGLDQHEGNRRGRRRPGYADRDLHEPVPELRQRRG